MDKKLLDAVLAMDSYNRSYNEGIKVTGSALGNISILTTDTGATFDSSQLKDANGNRLDQSIGFYAIAYKYQGETIISYRGTDQFFDGNGIGGDVFDGYLSGAGVADTKQSRMAIGL